MLSLLLFILLTGDAFGASQYHETNCEGNRVAIVHLFEYKWSDVAKECEEFLSPRGFCGVQVSPAHEHAIVTTDAMHPWWQRYQPVSYILGSRSGNEEQFKEMVTRCNNVNVRIYVDIVLNHMAGLGREGTGSAGSYFKSDDRNFPGVPFSSNDFNSRDKCPSGSGNIENYQDPNQVRNCMLSSLTDLDQSKDYVRGKMQEFLNRMIGYGVAGFRVDAAKHMWPNEMSLIFNGMNNLNTQWFPSGARPFLAHEVIDQNNEPIKAQQYVFMGRVTEFRYCSKIREKVDQLWDIQGVYDPGWGMLPPEDAFVFVDNHDNQRGHGGGGNVLTFRDPRRYKIGQAITLGYTYGYPRLMSSYQFSDHKDGPPHNPDWSTKDVDCSTGEWICEHRWQPIAAMAGFAKAVKGTSMQNWWTEGNQMAFSRGNKGFLAITNHDSLDKTLHCGLPAGQYCNVITGFPTQSGCAGETVTVDSSGNVRVQITNKEEPIFAIHVEAMSGGGVAPTNAPTVEPPPLTTRQPGTGDMRRTVIFIKIQTSEGQDLFIRGGINHNQRPGCSENAHTSQCALSITHNQLGSTSHYAKHNAWRVGDTKLDWYGAESGQGSYNGQQAQGSPLAWTSNSQSSPGYQPLNKWGDHHWMIDFEMDCSETENGWFELKGYIDQGGSGSWEGNISQDGTCVGSAGGSKPYSSSNHFARCGYLNKFEYNAGGCTIDNL